MYQFSYSEVLADSVVDARAQERLAFAHAIALLERAEKSGPSGSEAEEALRFTTDMWALFIKDLAQPGNDLPAETRAALMSIGLWVMAEAQRIQAGQSHSFAKIAEICSTIRDGLV